MPKQAFRASAPPWFGRINVSADGAENFGRPRAKLRGGRRYYRKLRRDAGLFVPSLSAWHNLDHWHVDWRGRGNASWRARRAHLDALFEMFRRLVDHLATREGPSQCWVLINAVDASRDGLYLHTPNPYTTPFPIDFSSTTTWDIDIPECLAPFLSDPAWQVGRSDAGDTTFFVRPRPAAELEVATEPRPADSSDTIERDRAAR